MIVEDGAVRTEYGIEESESRDIRNLILGDVVKGPTSGGVRTSAEHSLTLNDLSESHE
jgi:hypothetical protein